MTERWGWSGDHEASAPRLERRAEVGIAGGVHVLVEELAERVQRALVLGRVDDEAPRVMVSAR